MPSFVCLRHICNRVRIRLRRSQAFTNDSNSSARRPIAADCLADFCPVGLRGDTALGDCMDDHRHVCLRGAEPDPGFRCLGSSAPMVGHRPPQLCGRAGRSDPEHRLVSGMECEVFLRSVSARIHAAQNPAFASARDRRYHRQHRRHDTSDGAAAHDADRGDGRPGSAVAAAAVRDHGPDGNIHRPLWHGAEAGPRTPALLDSRGLHRNGFCHVPISRQRRRVSEPGVADMCGAGF